VPAGEARVHLLYLVDCLLSHARRTNAPAPVAHGLPAMAGAGLTRMLALAASDDASRARVARTLDAWGRKGLLEASYLRLGYERLAAMGSAAATAGASGSGASGVRQRVEKRRVRSIDRRCVPPVHCMEQAQLPCMKQPRLLYHNTCRRRLPPQRSSGCDYRLARVILPAPPREVAEAEIMPELAQRTAQADVSGRHAASPPSPAAVATAGSAGHQLCCNLFGPAVEVVLLMDPFGSMAEGGSGADSRSRALGAPLLKQLLGDAALALQLRPDDDAALLPDPVQESLADSRVAAWRDVLAPGDEERARAEAAAVAEQAQCGQQPPQHHPEQTLQQPPWLETPQEVLPTHLQQWGGPVQQQQQQQQLVGAPPWQNPHPHHVHHHHQQQQQQQPMLWQVQPPLQGMMPQWHSSTPPDPGVGEGREASVEGDDDPHWITNVPAAPQRDDAAELARRQGAGQMRVATSACWAAVPEDSPAQIVPSHMTRFEPAVNNPF
jgi:hypothetical protein